MIDFEPNAPGAACNALIAVALQHGPARPLPGPTIPTAGRVVLPVSWAPAERRAVRTPGPGGEGAAIEAAPHSLGPPLAPLAEGTDAAPNGSRVGHIPEKNVAEAPARAALKAAPVSYRTVGLAEPPVVHAGVHGRTSVIVMTVCGVRLLAFRATSSTTWRSSSKAMPLVTRWCDNPLPID